MWKRIQRLFKTISPIDIDTGDDMDLKHVEGVDKGHILMYALSTCVWCKKTKRLLNELGVDYYYIDVDSLKGDEKKKVESELLEWNPKKSFPTIILNNETALISFDEDKIREALDESK